jgi:hypothetical protein
VIPDGVRSIEGAAFTYCTSLSSLAIPSSVTNIGISAFSVCTSLVSVTIPDHVPSIAEYAFFHCTNLTSVTMGHGVTNIGQWAFEWCTSLASVSISDSVRSIDWGAFAGCSRLMTVTIGHGLTNIGEMAFESCASLTGLFLKGNAFYLPPFIGYAFRGVTNAIVYYLPGTTGWGPTFGGLPTAPWALPNPLILTTPPEFGVGTNGYGFVISWATNASVVVEVCEDLALPEWSPVGTNTLVEGWSHFSDPEWTNYANRFYRLRSP